VGAELAVFRDEFRDCFGRSEPRGKLAAYVRGQLGELPRQSVEPIALAAGMKPRTLQEFLASDAWDEERLQAHTYRLLTRDHADDPLIGVIDESGHPKQGVETAGVSRQYCGNTGKIDNGVMTVHLTATSFDGAFRTLLESELYLPKSWHEDRERCRAAKIPDDVVYRSKYQMALEQLDRATAHGVRFSTGSFAGWRCHKRPDADSMPLTNLPRLRRPGRSQATNGGTRETDLHQFHAGSNAARRCA
jgi:SRSO17 transposase